MNRIDATFKRLKKEKKKALITYIAAGDPNMSTTAKLALSLEEAGADIIELGIPFSDPLADGPTIQRASQRALSAGCTVKKILDMVKKVREKVSVPIVFMTYYNIVFNYGLEKFVKDALRAGADGIIVPDLPIEESRDLEKAANDKGFSIIQLAAPTTPPARFKKIAARSKGFVYYVSLTGVTGARTSLPSELKKKVKSIKKLTTKPVCVGFGVSDAAQAKAVAQVADGVIVGSAIIKVLERDLKNKKNIAQDIERFTRSLAKAVHGKN